MGWAHVTVAHPHDDPYVHVLSLHFTAEETEACRSLAITCSRSPSWEVGKVGLVHHCVPRAYTWDHFYVGTCSDDVNEWDLAGSVFLHLDVPWAGRQKGLIDVSGTNG